MTYTVYGIHRPGSSEIRYVGQTKQPMLVRARQHLSEQAVRSPFKRWLGQGFSTVTIHTCATRDEALFCERIAIRECVRMGFRLFNCQQMPRARRNRRRA